MPTLTIEASAADGRSASFRFGQSPVTIGSGPLSDLVLGFPFISQCHAMVHFADWEVWYLDLGSRNGSVVAGAAAQANTPLMITPKTDIVLGPLRLRMSVSTDAHRGSKEGDVHEHAYLGIAGQPNPPGDRPTETTALPVGFSADEFLAFLGGRRPQAPEAASPRALTRHLAIALSQLRHPHPPEAAPTPPTAPAGRPAPQRPAPPVAHEVMAGFTRRIGAPGASASAGPVTLRDRLATIAAALPTEDDRQLLLGIVALAEHAAEAFIALKGARQTMGDELGIRAVQGNSAVHRARSPAELLDHVLEVPAEALHRVRQLTRATSELLVVHEMAFLAALREGVAALVEHLDPRGPVFAEGRGRLGLFGLREYETFYAAETEDPWRAILGQRFARSYAVAMRTEDRAREGRSPSSSGGLADALARGESPRSAPEFDRICFSSGPLAGREVGLGLSEVTLGRAEDNIVVIDHPSISRYHAVIARDGDGWMIADAGSRNGIVVNGRSVPSAKLREGDSVEIGEVTFRFASARLGRG